MGKNYEEHLAERTAQKYTSTRLWAPNPDAKGMRGEQALANYFGYEMSYVNKPKGDDGIDRWFALTTDNGVEWFSVDVKAAESKDERYKPKLSVNILKVHRAQIYVLAQYFSATDTAVLLGWESRAEVKKADITYKWCGNDADVHQIRAGKLRPMRELYDRYFTSVDDIEYRAMGLR